MKTIKRLQYITFAIIALIFFEGMMTLGSVFHFEEYGIFAWIVQGMLLIAAITTALRVAEEGE